VVNHGWARPAPNLIAGRVPTINRANTVSNDHRTYPGRGSSGWHHDGPRHAWGGAYAAAAGFQARATAYDGPRYAWGGDYSGYSYSPYYGDSPYNDSYPSSGSASDSGASGSSYQPASSSPVPASEGATTTDQETAAAERYMELARRAFRMGDYAEAQRECEGALRLLPGDANLYEFGALCRFAQGNYKDAAATLYQVLAARPGWSWDTLTSFYPSAQTYTTQLRALERYARADPGDAAGHFVLAYHYRALDERDAAVGQLREVIKLQPRDQVSPGILETLEKAKDGKDGAPARRPAPGLAE